MLLSTN